MPVDLTQTDTLKERTVASYAVASRVHLLRSIARTLLASQTTGMIEDYALAHLRVRLTSKALVCEATDRIRFARTIVPVKQVKLPDGGDPEGYIAARDGKALLTYLKDKRLPRTLIVVIKDRGVEFAMPPKTGQVFKPRQFASEHRNVLRYPNLDAFVVKKQAAITLGTVDRGVLAKLLADAYTLIRRLNPEDAYYAGVLDVLKSGKLNVLVGEVPVGSMDIQIETMIEADRRTREINVKLVIDWLNRVSSAKEVSVGMFAGKAPVRFDVPGAMYVLAPLASTETN